MARGFLLASVAFVTLSLPLGCQQSFDKIRESAMIHSGGVYVLEGAEGSRVLVTPSLMGRVLTSKVGGVESVGFVSLPDIESGHWPGEPFRNFGGQDRLWVGPESSQFGLFFDQGAEINSDTWRVPDALNSGAMEVVSYDEAEKKLVMACEMTLVNYSGVSFRVSVNREIGLIPSKSLNEEIGAPLPQGVDYVGSYSLNTLTNSGDEKWSRAQGLPCIWTIGQFNAESQAVVIAPFRPATEGVDLGPPYDDTYFGAIPENRLSTLGTAVVFRADARHRSKFGVDPARCRGFAASYSPRRRLLTIVKFDVDREDPLYASFHWGKKFQSPYDGDVLQAYNHAGASSRDKGLQGDFYELESTSPCKELAPNESLVHRHATFCFVGSRKSLNVIAIDVLGVDLNEALAALDD